MSCSRTVSKRCLDASVPQATTPNTDFKSKIHTIHANMMMMIVSVVDDDGVRGDNNNDDDDDDVGDDDDDDNDDDDTEQGFKVARR